MNSEDEGRPVAVGSSEGLGVGGACDPGMRTREKRWKTTSESMLATWCAVACTWAANGGRCNLGALSRSHRTGAFRTLTSEGHTDVLPGCSQRSQPICASWTPNLI